MIQVNRIYLIFNRLVTKKFLVDTSDTGINLILYNRELGIFQNLNEREFTYTAVPERLLLYEAIYGSRLLYIPYIN